MQQQQQHAAVPPITTNLSACERAPKDVQKENCISSKVLGFLGQVFSRKRRNFLVSQTPRHGHEAPRRTALRRSCVTPGSLAPRASEERGRRFLQPAHRSRSEGPIGRDLDDDSFLVSEYKTQYAWVRRPPSARGPEAAPLLEVEKPPSQPTKHQVNINGVAGGASTGASAEGAGTTGDTQPAEEQLQRTPRKSKSMGRIHGGETGPEVGGGASGGPDSSGGTQEGQHDQAPQQPRTDTAAPSQHWHRGHRRTPSDGVAWRHSKGTHGPGHTQGCPP
ncbi:hypothetical protein E2C01_023867 [Portunus trituberculatus]|uniref:Uncharacterized protein n=1 Tax=Portunus trituberculatus TaxID=210409 RepID=A0A5B7E920_PORTR|nr:hypothetical protein [Portunus trituberculatus]